MEALQAGRAVLAGDGTSLDAVTAAVRVLENCGVFNAGKGAVPTRDGTIELDAAVMDGATLRAGAVAAVRYIANPVDLARRVMEATPHVFLVGRGAEQFARRQHMPRTGPDYFVAGGQRDAPGTVGAVALDRHGHLAAATSTGGIAGQWPGRVGDSPVIGAGTYANDATCAVSATGHGESLTRAVVGYGVSALMAHARLGVQAAARRMIMEDLAGIGGTGGLIAVDRRGRIAMPFNTPGMSRGSVRDRERPRVAIGR